MAIDLDRYAEPPRDDATLAGRRAALIDQLGWLESEAGALAPLLGALPTWAIRQAPLPTELSAAETFAAFAVFDRTVVPAWLARVQTEDTPDLTTPDPLPLPDGAGEPELDALLADVQAARADLRARFAALDADVWSRPLTLDGRATDLYGVGLAICQRDADHLRALAYRLHEADLRDRTPPPTP